MLTSYYSAPLSSGPTSLRVHELRDHGTTGYQIWRRRAEAHPRENIEGHYRLNRLGEKRNRTSSEGSKNPNEKWGEQCLRLNDTVAEGP